MDNLDRRVLLGAAGLAGVGVLASLAKGGPLSPPGGPVGSTGRTLDEIYNKIPSGLSDGRTLLAGGTINHAINASGSYVLGGNMTGTITINASGVTVDLNGFSVNAPTPGSGNGVLVSGTLSRVVIRNGILSGFNAGVALALDANSIIVEDLLIRESRQYGVLANSAASRNITVRRCTVSETGANSASSTGSFSIHAISLTGSGHVIEDCVVQTMKYLGTGTPTFRGISLTDAAGTMNVVRRCVVTSFPAVTGDGVRMLGLGVYRDNTVMGFSTSFNGGSSGGGNVP